MRDSTSQQIPGHFELNTNSPQARGLVGWWPAIGNGRLRFLRDRSLYGNFPSRAAFLAALTWQNKDGIPCYAGGNSSTSYAVITDTLALRTIKSVSVWVYNAMGAWQLFGLCSKGAMGADNGLCGYTRGTGNVVTIYWGSIATSEVVFPSGWNHIAINVATTSADIYLNGVSIGTGIGSITGPFNNTGDFRIGNAFYVSERYIRSNNYIGDVRAYNRLLSPGEILALWKPETRWELYKADKPQRWFVPAAGGAISGSAAITLDGMTAAGTGTLAIAGAASITLAGTTVSTAGALAIRGSLDQSLSAVTISAAGVVALSGAVTQTVGGVTISAAGVLAIQGSLGAGLDAVTISAAGVSQSITTGALDSSIDAVTISSAGSLALSGSLAQVLADAALGAMGSLALTGAAAITIGATSLVGTGSLAIFGSAGMSLAAVLLTAIGTSTIVETPATRTRTASLDHRSGGTAGGGRVGVVNSDERVRQL